MVRRKTETGVKAQAETCMKLHGYPPLTSGQFQFTLSTNAQGKSITLSPYWEALCVLLILFVTNPVVMYGQVLFYFLVYNHLMILGVGMWNISMSFSKYNLSHIPRMIRYFIFTFLLIMREVQNNGFIEIIKIVLVHKRGLQ
ncbi:hypothetical protein CAAN1_11S05402 [[Candida] anglica]|uniref:Uncharacterized protein n=1 Tax=[Candida] anglica TaxID=148631 RepID=A0ABP0EM95_9ASCO